MSLIITGVLDGPLSGGLPKAIELYVTADIADLSIYGLGSANNGGGTDGQEFTFPSDSASAGSYIYVSSEATGLPAFLGFAPDYTTGAAGINGDDAIELFQSGAVIDTFGVPNVDGSGEVWDYLDGWAVRKPGTIASAIFNPDDWTYSGANALDGETSNATAATPFPVASYATPAPVIPNIVINEIDSDQTGTDSAEFIELYDGGAGGTALDGLSLVLFNGNGDAEYRTISLDGQVTDAAGYFVIGSASVANVDLALFTTNGIQNGADAVALYHGTAPSAPTTDNLLDAIAYDTSDGDDATLMAALGLSVQHNENANGAKDTEALARVPDGTGDWVAQAPTPGTANAGAAPAIVINEIDSDQTGTDSTEFVELYDGGVGGTSLDGLSLVLFNGNGDAAYNAISLDGLTTDAEGYFVLGSAAVANVDYVAFTNNGLQNGADAVALYTGTPPATATSDNLVDAVVYDTSDGDDAGLLAALGQTVQHNENGNGAKDTEALARVPDGTGDWVAQAPTPGAVNEIVAPPTITKIHTVQGNAGTGNGAVAGTDDRSALTGSIVTIEAIVTADFQDGLLGSMGDLNGFYVQEEDADADGDATTSEGLFIFDGTLPSIDVAVGDKVQITGTVAEFFGETQLSASDVVVISSGQTLPTAVNVSFPVASVMVDDDGGLLANLEAYEGMRVQIAQDMTLSEMFNLDRFGQYNVSAGRPEQFTQNNAPDAAGFAAHQSLTARSTIVLDDGATSQNPDVIKIIDGNDGVLTAADSFRMGDTLANVTGVVGYAFDEFRIQNGTGTYTASNPRPATPEDLGGNFTVASLNVLNYFTTIDENGNTTDNGSGPRGADSSAEFDRQATKLVNAIVAMDADILGLVEIENDFAGETFAIKDLVARVNTALGGEVYGFVDPGVAFVGGDAIANGLIYKIGSVGVQGSMAVLTEFDGRDFLDPLDAGRDLNRAAIAQTFEDLDTGETLTVSVNHLKSKGSLSGLEADNDQGDGQGNNNATRTEAAKILGDWLAADPTGQGAENVLILGDLNAYAREDPVTALAAKGYTDLAASLLGNSAYSYVFDGQTGTLDYALANQALAGDVVGITEWHINSDEADAIDYNLDFGRSATFFDASSPARNSDHDPVIVAFQFEINYNEIAGDGGNNRLTGTEGRDRIDAGAGNDAVSALGGEDLIIAGSGRNDRFSGGADADTFQFSDAIANDGVWDRYNLTDFDASEDMIDLGGATIAAVAERARFVQLTLDGDGDRIIIWRNSEFDDIQFVDNLLLG